MGGLKWSRDGWARCGLFTAHVEFYKFLYPKPGVEWSWDVHLPGGSLVKAGARSSQDKAMDAAEAVITKEINKMIKAIKNGSR